MKSKTAIRQLIEFMKNYSMSDIIVQDVVAKAKELESINEQQIKEARASLYADLTGMKKENCMNFGEQYFNKTFEKP